LQNLYFLNCFFFIFFVIKKFFPKILHLSILSFYKVNFSIKTLIKKIYAAIATTHTLKENVP